MSSISARIIGTGSHLPATILTNAELEKRVETTDQWIRERTGIEQRHIAADGEYTSDLAVAAAEKALAAAGVPASELDLIIVGTTTPDVIFPSTACLVQHRLGAKDCPAFDVNAACTGFLYALSIADKFVRTGAARTALVIGAETLSRMLDWSDRGTCVLFGDGAGAVVLRADNAPGVISTHIHADGQYQNLLHNPVGVSRGFKDEPNHGVRVLMSGNEVFRVAVRTLSRIVDETLAHNGLSKDAIDWLVPHQANLRIISATAKHLDMPMERVIVTVNKHGNTSSGSVPLALDHGVHSGQIKPGQLLLLEAFGGGFTWGSALLRI
ncbi:MAG: ketoacyl-ACP synthase III [Xanthomonadales bacterium]|nr:3-oxoacyl-[acyl-carrier-protein] synthase 3 [Xanthomonadales bacterium]MCC6594142.1 ketoacyl-ACP synthase III [Xanthomonadales bacterium]MCE7931350.1 ketoacyl-ACP synthase III [Xanthomonadales bacterium PRO6]